MIKFAKFYETYKDQKYKIFLDLDGVICGFEEQYNNYSQMSMTNALDEYTEHSEEFWEPVNKAKVEFWSEMPWTADGRQLWDYVKPYNPFILSSTGRGGACPKGKVIWIEKELGEDVPYILEKNKYKYSGENKILIDDTEGKITTWIEAGGIGILHTSTEDTIEKLKELGL